MRTRNMLLRLAVAVLVLTTTAAWAADDGLKVTKLRTKSVGLYKCDKVDAPQPAETYTQDQFKQKFTDGWPVNTTQPPPTGFLAVRVIDTMYCVKAYAVETNRRISTTAAECNARVGTAEPKSGASRGIGEECASPLRRRNTVADEDPRGPSAPGRSATGAPARR